ncbi:adenosine receptor A1-like [Oculina patagonica]
MAALFGHTYYWNATAKIVFNEFKKQVIDWESHGQATIIGIVYVLVSVITVLGNALVIFAVWKDPLKILRTSPTNFILLSLAISDFIVGIINAPGLASWFLRVGIKKTDPWYFQSILLIFTSALLIVSVSHVLFLTLDRYFALATPLKYRTRITKRRVIITTSAIWICCFCYAVSTSIIQQYFPVIWFIAVVVIFLFSETVYILYLMTLVNLIKHSRARNMVENSHSNAALLYQREKKVFRVIVSVIFVYDICYSPWMVTQLVLYFCKPCYNYYRVVIICYNVTTVLLFVNSALNPFLYSWRFSKFRATFKHFWNKFSQKGRRNQTVRITERRLSFNTRL